MSKYWNVKFRFVALCLAFVMTFPLCGTAWSQGAAVQKSSPPKSAFPAAAWAVESVGAVLGALGFVAVGVGTSFLNERNNLESDAVRSSELKDVPNAKDVKQNQDIGMGMIVGGWVTAGVGVTMMVVGAIWLLTHKPKSSQPLPKIDSSSSQSFTPLSFE